VEQLDVFSHLRLSIQTILIAGLPVTIGALAIGLTIAIFQALTQIQEMTLTFVPKIIGILIILAFALPFMFSRLQVLATVAFDAISSGPL
jgi:flagellar biosynthetic protein FliQ